MALTLTKTSNGQAPQPTSDIVDQSRRYLSARDVNHRPIANSIALNVTSVNYELRDESDCTVFSDVIVASIMLSFVLSFCRPALQSVTDLGGEASRRRSPLWATDRRSLKTVLYHAMRQ